MRRKKGSRQRAGMTAQAVAAIFPSGVPLNVDPVLTEDEAALLLGFSKDTLRRENKAGRGVPRVRLSQRRIGYRLSAIYARLEANTENVERQPEPAQSTAARRRYGSEDAERPTECERRRHDR